MEEEDVILHKGVPCYVLDCAGSMYEYFDKEDLQAMIDDITSWENRKEKQ